MPRYFYKKNASLLIIETHPLVEERFLFLFIQAHTYRTFYQPVTLENSQANH